MEYHNVPSRTRIKVAFRDQRSYQRTSSCRREARMANEGTASYLRQLLCLPQSIPSSSLGTLPSLSTTDLTPSAQSQDIPWFEECISTQGDAQRGDQSRARDGQYGAGVRGGC